MTLVLVHGFTQTERSWDPVPLPEARALRVPDGLDFAGTAAALGEEGGRGTYVGYSMGGRLCLQLALDRPDLVERLVLVSASPGIEDEAARAARRAADERLAQEIERDGVDAFLERWLAQPLFASLPRDAADLDDRRAANTAARLTHQLRALGQGAQPSNWDGLPRLHAPTLLVAGALDPKYAAIARAMRDRMGGAASVVVVDDAGHAVHIERADAFAHLVTSWLGSR